MAYEKNARENPEAQTHIAPQVTANPVNTSVTYSAQAGDIVKTQATMNMLEGIGAGLIGIDKGLQNSAPDIAFALDNYMGTEGKANKEQWAEASKNINGLAKYNPYVRDEYKKIVAQNVQREAELELAGIPRDFTMSHKDYEQRIQDIKNDMYAQFQSLGLNTNHYKDYAEQFEKTLQAARKQYTQRNAEYTYQNTLRHLSYTLSADASTALLNAQTNDDKIGIFKDVLDSWDSRCNSLGIPDSDKAAALKSGLSEFIIDNPDLMTRGEYLKALSGITVGDKNIKEFIPDFAKDVSDLIIQAKRQGYNEKQLEWATRELDCKIATEKASSDFLNWINENPNATGSEIENKARELENQYAMGSDGFGFYGSVTSLRNHFKSLREVGADDEAAADFWCDVIDGNISDTYLKEAVVAGIIKGETANSIKKYLERETSSTNSNMTSDVLKHGKELIDSISRRTDIFENDKEKTRAFNQLKGYLEELTRLDITPERVREIEDIFTNFVPKEQGRVIRKRLVSSSSVLMNGVFLKNAKPAPPENINEIQKNIESLGLFGNLKTKVTSGIGQRNVKGHENHNGIDIVTESGNTTVVLPRGLKNAKCTDAGYTPSTGWYMVIETPHGAMRLLHLKEFDTAKFKGKNLKEGQPLAHYGHISEGVTGAHLHIDLWEKTDSETGWERCSSSDFLKMHGIKQKYSNWR